MLLACVVVVRFCGYPRAVDVLGGGLWKSCGTVKLSASSMTGTTCLLLTENVNLIVGAGEVQLALRQVC